MVGLFQRVNFFKGLFMKTKDWQKEQEYHMEKQRFHNKYLHTPGVVFQCLGGLRVSVSDTGDKLVVPPGYAIDGEGRDLYVPEPKEIIIPNLQSFNPPTTIYISLRYTENLQDRRDDTENPMYSGHAYAAEDTIIEITGRKPDNHHCIELGRVRLSENASRIHNPDSPGDTETEIVPAAEKSSVPRRTRADRHKVEALPLPGLDELDLTQVQEAGAITQSRTGGLSISHLADKLIDTKMRVIAGTRKQEDTNVLIEQYPKEMPPPMYMVFLQSLDGVRTRWSIECTENDRGSLDYTLHIRNESNRTATVMCRVYRMRV